MNSLVHYDSSDDDTEEQIVCLKRKASNDVMNESLPKMPKLPSFFDKPEPVQIINSKNHEGRVRTVPHQHDSWATYVYCKVDLSHELQQLLPHLKEAKILPEQHISLSRPVYLRKYQLDSFTTSIKATLRNLSKFDISFAQAQHLTNDERTRFFLTLEIGYGYNELFKCMDCVDKVMREYRKPTFYDPPRFHASIAWSLQELTIESIHIPPDIIEELAKSVHHIIKNSYKYYILMQNFAKNFQSTD
ncbi:hypothetical protein INT46_009892 [Mucor plumbeus]|uniref:U6 snRNA phosphodiesterase 1 n=1 Tax=Mucor plumbeus TaxID=97098 RepID=A0A8H7VGK2_9FUNG|nr:hypothetical protein INT46_009892 [Mucor plumbeus]